MGLLLSHRLQLPEICLLDLRCNHKIWMLQRYQIKLGDGPTGVSDAPPYPNLTFGDGAQVQHTGPAAAQLYAHDRWALRRVKAFARRHRLLEEPLDHLLRDHASCRKRGRTSEQRVELLAGCSKAASPAY